MSIIYLDTFFNVSLHTYYMVSERIKNKIWNDASKIKGKNPNTWRKDNCHKTVRRGSYGTNGEYGWHADHKHPVAKGGTNNIRNYQLLHKDSNRSKSDKYNSNYCKK